MREQTPNEWYARLWDIYERASDLPEPERGPWIGGACEGDSELHAAVLAILASEAEPEAILGEAAPAGTLELLLDGGGQLAAETRLGPYRLIQLLGRGGMGEVYLAEDEQGRRLALKRIRPECVTGESLQRLGREAELLRRVRHPGIAEVYAADTLATPEGPRPILAMRWIDGRSLAHHLERMWTAGGTSGARREPTRRREPPEQRELQRFLGWMHEVARILAAAHSAGVVHRDVKPSNVLIEHGERPVLVDFGIARDVAGNQETITRSGSLIGTPEYVAPEQISGRVDERTDLWAVGVTLYRGLTGRLPFSGPTRAAVLHAVLRSEPPRVRRLNPSVSRSLAAVVDTALEKDPERRYQSAHALADDLQAVLEGRPVRVRPLSARRRLARWARREPGAALAAGALVLLSLTLSGWAIHAVATSEQRALGAATRTAREIDLQLAEGHDWLTLALLEGQPDPALAQRASEKFSEILLAAKAQGEDHVIALALAGAVAAAMARGEQALGEALLAGHAPLVERYASLAALRDYWAGTRRSLPREPSAEGHEVDQYLAYLWMLESIASWDRDDLERARLALDFAERIGGSRTVYLYAQAHACFRAHGVLAEAGAAEALALEAPRAQHVAAMLRRKLGDTAPAAFYSGLALMNYDAEAATAAYARAIELAAERPPELAPGLPMAWRNLAVLHFDARRFDAAAEAYRGLLAGRPDDQRARVGLAECLAFGGRVAEAEAELATLVADELPPDLRSNIDHLQRAIAALPALEAHRNGTMVDPAQALELAEFAYFWRHDQRQTFELFSMALPGIDGGRSAVHAFQALDCGLHLLESDLDLDRELLRTTLLDWLLMLGDALQDSPPPQRKMTARITFFLLHDERAAPLRAFAEDLALDPHERESWRDAFEALR